MQTLRGAREAAGMTQQRLSQLTGIPGPVISNFEKGTSPLTLLQMIRCEQELNERLDWQDSVRPGDRERLLSVIGTLASHYPLFAVMQAAMKNLPGDLRQGCPSTTLSFYLDQAGTLEQEILMPPEIRRTR